MYKYIRGGSGAYSSTSNVAEKESKNKRRQMQASDPKEETENKIKYCTIFPQCEPCFTLSSCKNQRHSDESLRSISKGFVVATPHVTVVVFCVFLVSSHLIKPAARESKNPFGAAAVSELAYWRQFPANRSESAALVLTTHFR